MNPERQRVVIAELRGWAEIKPGFAMFSVGPTGIHPEHRVSYSVPDYLNDLNAMHQAEESLNKAQTHLYHDWILEIVRRDAPSLQECENGKNHASRWSWHSSAAQRAEAFLRTLNKWEDS